MQPQDSLKTSTTGLSNDAMYPLSLATNTRKARPTGYTAASFIRNEALQVRFLGSMVVMSPVQHHIPPKLPTVLGDCARINLPGQDLLLRIICNVHIVQMRLDVSTFEEALSKTLGLYSHAAGQLAVAMDPVNTGKRPRSLYCGDVTAMVNSTTRIDWRSVHLRRPDGSRFFQTGFLKHWLSCSRSNPAKGQDGVWRARRSVDVSMEVRAELRPELLEVLASGFQYILDDDDDDD